MAELIDREKCQERIFRFADRLVDWGFPKEAEAVRAVAKGLKLEKTVDAVPLVHGRWEYDENPDYDGNYQAYCSVCGAGDKHALYMIGCVPYCWKCGAIMDLEVKDA